MLLPLLSLVLAGLCVPQPLPEGRQAGVTVRVYQLEGEIKRVPTLAAGQTPNVDEVLGQIDLGSDQFPGVSGEGGAGVKAPFMTVVRGWVTAPADGAYVFRLTSDDGSRLSLDGKVVVNHDGRHGVTSKDGYPFNLRAGRPVELLVEHFDAGGGRRLRLEWAVDGGEVRAPAFTLVPTGALSTEIDNARVVAPGVKKVVGPAPARPGDGVPVEGVHPAFTVERMEFDTSMVEGFQPMIGAMAYLPDGRLVVGTFNPLQRDEVNLPDIESKVPDRLYAITRGEKAGDPHRVSVCAEGLYEPLGLCVVGKDLYVAHRRAVTRLRDGDGDGFFEQRHDVAGGTAGFGWEAWNYHQFTFGLLHHQGKLYTALSTAMAPPGWEGMGTNAAPNDPLRGAVLEIDLASESFRVITAGVRTPNGLGFGPMVDGVPSLFYADNQGAWMPSNHFGEVVRGRFFGHFNNTNFVPKLAQRFPKGGIASIWADRLRAPPAVDLVHNDLCNSPTESVLIPIESMNGGYPGQMLVGELTAGGLRRVALERVNGSWQGAAFQFSQGFSVGINRLAWDWHSAAGQGPTLTVGGIGAAGNWNWKGTKAGLDRLVPSGGRAFEMRTVRATPTGFRIEFTKPVAEAWLRNPGNYTVMQWTYQPTAEYGGAKTEYEPAPVSHAVPDDDGRAVVLTIPWLKAGRTVRIRVDPVSVDGEPIWATEAFYALNQVPTQESVEKRGSGWTEHIGVGALPPAESAVLIGASARTHFRTPKESSKEIEQGRSQKDLQAGPGYADVGNGDLVSRASFGDCHLHVEWFAPAGGHGQLAGNSGIYLQDRYEIQVLGTPARKWPMEPNEAGSIYGVRAPSVNASSGPGTWQAYDIFFTAPRFEGDVKKSSAKVTLYWNGQVVHEGVEVAAPTGAASAKGETGKGREDGVQIGPVRLQAHATDAEGPVRYRNVWVRPLHRQLKARSGDARWVSLTDSSGSGTHTLDGFVVRGGAANYTLEDEGVIVGRTAPNTPNTFLVTRKRYIDFDLLADVWIDGELNSGIQVRSRLDIKTVGEGVTQEERLFGDRGARLRGYQVEIDPGARAFTGGIYDEGRRGWLVPLTDNPAGRSAFKPGEWNRIEVEARGERIETWVNGTPAATLFDATDADGHIALQVHGVGGRVEPLTVRFRDVRVRER